MLVRYIALLLCVMHFMIHPVLSDDETAPEFQAGASSLKQAILTAGDNRDEIEAALLRVPEDQKSGMAWLIAHMPDRDLRSLSADYLLENCALAHEALSKAPWKDNIPQDLFLDSVLPFASVSEPRDRWRKDFYEKFMPLVAEAKTPSEAAAILNREIYPLIKVKYSANCRRADQSPYESIEQGIASCTGLSVLLIDACRAVGIPARFVGIPMWLDESGNHSWVEIWDDGWHFTGAAEPTGDELNKGWFTDRAAATNRDNPQNAIYAVTWRRTPVKFPMYWQPDDHSIYAVDITDRYTAKSQPIPADMAKVRISVIDENTGTRCIARVSVIDETGRVIFTGTSKDERFDTNDHLWTIVPLAKPLKLAAHYNDRSQIVSFSAEDQEQLITIKFSVSSGDKHDNP